jgi:secondary thiamine-phosphate synthase enzyme
MRQFSIRTRARAEMTDITGRVRQVLREEGWRDGVCVVFVPHTTAAVTINENADPAVPRDILAGLERLAPRDAGYRHAEGNADAHIKASLVGSSVTVCVAGGELVLGTWQSVFFCEFDGPRTRQVVMQVIAAA